MTRDEILNLQAGGETDALIAENIMGWQLHPHKTHWLKGGGHSIQIGFFLPSTDISAAWEVVINLTNKGFAPNLVNDDNGRWYLSFDGTQDLSPVSFVTAFTDVPELWCDTAPLAICRAGLLAVMK